MNNKFRMFGYLAFLILTFFAAAIAQKGNYYYTCSYAKPEWGTDILFSKIDLDQKAIVYSKEIPLTGEICLRIPLKIKQSGKDYFFVSTIYGLAGHNTPIATPYGYYALLGSNGQLLQRDSIFDTHFLHPIDSLKNGIEYIDSTGANIIATLSIDMDSKVNINNLGINTYSDKDYPIISGFRYYNQIAADNNLVYWDLVEKGAYLLLIDRPNHRLIDSLNISVPNEYFYLLGLAEENSMIYTFYLDCKCKGWRYPGEIEQVIPSYLKRFSSDNLVVIDSINVFNPCLDSTCIGNSWAVCDRVNDYLVYYFAESEAIEQFFPGKLFIFDTRTNEATWLRVGWR